MSKFAVMNPKAKSKKYEHWEFLSAVLDGNHVCRGICAMDLRTMEIRTFPADADHHRNRRYRGNLRQEHELGRLHRIGAVSALPAGLLLRKRRVDPGAPDRRSPAKTSFA